MLIALRTIAILLCCSFLSTQLNAAPRSVPLETWMDNELIPSVVRSLTTHPRFQDQVIRFVVMENGKPAPRSNALAVALRDHLQRAVVARSNTRVAWQADQMKFDRRSEQFRVDCTANSVHYYIGVEIGGVESGQYRASVRALEVAQQRWVDGVGGVWRGRLSSSQLRQFRSPKADPAFLGERAVPFDDSQTDLLAAQLAHDLGCSVLRQLSGEYVAQQLADGESVLQELTELVANNLAAYKALQITGDNDSHNSVIESTAHMVDDDLYQYWITLTPTNADSDLPTISASAYIYLPEKFLPITLASSGQTAGLSNDNALIESLQVVRMSNSGACPATSRQRIYSRQYDGNPSGCFALETKTKQDSIVFALYHQLNNGLVRMSGKECSGRSEARIARRDEAVLIPLNIDQTSAPSWLPADDWMINPDVDTYYVIASTNSMAARALGKHFERLPERCGTSLRPGKEGSELRRWFRELNAIAAYWVSDIDWQSVRVRNVY